jgi:sulfofructose kinase
LPDGRPRILFCGSATLDTIFRVDALPTGPGKVLPHQLAVVAHGMAASAAAAAARLGAEAVLISRLGDDDTGQRICDELTAAGVDCRHIRRFPGVTSALCTVIVDDTGERLVVPFYDPALPADPGWLPPDLLSGADAVMTDVRWPQGAAALLDAAKAAGKPAVLDADIGPREVLLDLAARATHAVFSEPGARIASGKPDAAAALDWLARRLDAVVAITLGPGGCIWVEGKHRRHAPGHRVQVVDTLAAGDIFHGVLTWALAQGSTFADAVAFANAAAAIKCLTFGGRLGAPDRDTLSRFLNAGPP